MNLPCSVRDLIPQKGKMGFEQTLFKIQPDNSESVALINRDNIFLDDNNQLSNAVLIEYVNQLIAAVKGYNGKYDNGPELKGLFVGVQEANFFKKVRLGDSIVIKGSIAAEISQVSFVQGVIERDGDRIAELVTKLYEVKDEVESDSLTGKGQLLGFGDKTPVIQGQPPTLLTSDLSRKLYSYIHSTNIGDGFMAFKIVCPNEFGAFDGHFPGNPILPGIVLLEIAKLALELLLKKPVELTYLKKMKISGVVLPNQAITCTVKVASTTGPAVSFSADFCDGKEREISRFTGRCDEGKR